MYRIKKDNKTAGPYQTLHTYDDPSYDMIDVPVPPKPRDKKQIEKEKNPYNSK